MMGQRAFRVIAALVLASSTLLVQAPARGQVVPAITITPDDNDTFIYPYDPGIDRRVYVTNDSAESVTIDFSHTFEFPNGQTGSTDVPPGPQPGTLYLDPGEERWVDLSTQWGLMGPKPWVKGDVVHLVQHLDFTIRLTNDPQHPLESLDLEQTILVKDSDPFDPPAPNAHIEGKVTRPDGTPLRGGQVTVVSDAGSSYGTTNRRGRFSVGVRAFRRTFSQSLLEQRLRIEKDGYAAGYRVVLVKPGDTKTLGITMRKAPSQLDYSLVSQQETGAPVYDGDASVDGSIAAVVPFHSAAPLQERMAASKLHVYSGTGELLWDYALGDETPAIDVADDGSAIVTTRQSSNGTANATSILVFDSTGTLIWEPAIAGVREVRLSHDGRYLAYGDATGNVGLLDLDTKTTLWTDFLEGQVRFIEFDTDDSKVFMSSGNLFMYALAIDGSRLWSTYVGGWATAMTLSDSYLFTTAKHGRYLSVLEKSTGDAVWQYPVITAYDSLLISSDETKFLAASSRGGGLDNAVFDASGRPVRDMNARDISPHAAAPFGNYIASISGVSPTNLVAAVTDWKGGIRWRMELDPATQRAPQGFAWSSSDGSRLILAAGAGTKVYFFERN